MPLKQSPSKKAFSKNVKMEMHAGKPQDQSLAIAYSIKRKNARKKMADGGDVSEEKPLKIELMEDQSEKRPLIIEPADEDEMSASDSAMKRRKMAYGGKAEDTNEPSVPMRKADNMRLPEDDYMSEEMAPGGMSDMEESDKRLPEDEYMSEYATGRRPMAYGGKAEDTNEPGVPVRKPDDMRLPKDEYMDDQFDDADSVYPMSLSEEAMHRRKMADGGSVDLDENAQEEPNNEDDMSFEALKKENYSEDAGLDHMDSPVDSNLRGHDLPDEDSHDMVDQMRSKVDYATHDEPNAYSMSEEIMRRMKSRRRS